MIWTESRSTEIRLQVSEEGNKHSTCGIPPSTSEIDRGLCKFRSACSCRKNQQNPLPVIFQHRRCIDGEVIKTSASCFSKYENCPHAVGQCLSTFHRSICNRPQVGNRSQLWESLQGNKKSRAMRDVIGVRLFCHAYVPTTSFVGSNLLEVRHHYSCKLLIRNRNPTAIRC